MPYGYVRPSTGFTIECWFKRDATSPNYQTLFNQRTQAAVNWPSSAIYTQGRQLIVELNPTTGALNVGMLNETTTTGTLVVGWADSDPGGYANDNQWHHVALRVANNKSTWALFVDGAIKTQLNTTAPLNWQPGILTFGAQYAPQLGNYGSGIWDDWLAYPAVYDKALTNSRIFEHYTAGAGGTVYYGDNEVTRLHRIADWAEVPDQAREFEDALTNLQGIQVADANALTAFQDTAAAASGLVFADGQSRLVYHNRRHRYNRWNVVTLGESLGSAPEIGITFSIDDENIYNDIRGDRPYGSTIRMIDNVSKAAHGRKTFSFSIPVTTHEELQNAVAWIASQYRYPKVRISEVTFRAESSDLIEWMGTGGVTIGDHITLIELPAEAAPEGTMEFVIEKMSVDVDIKSRVYKASFQLSPFEINQVFQVGRTNLGSTWRLGY
jgi:hypothetical protein